MLCAAAFPATAHVGVQMRMRQLHAELEDLDRWSSRRACNLCLTPSSEISRPPLLLQFLTIAPPPVRCSVGSWTAECGGWQQPQALSPRPRA